MNDASLKCVYKVLLGVNCTFIWSGLYLEIISNVINLRVALFLRLKFTFIVP